MTTVHGAARGPRARHHVNRSAVSSVLYDMHAATGRRGETRIIISATVKRTGACREEPLRARQKLRPRRLCDPREVGS
eukprot:CAMPEP_0185546588 /NCGR_PEP_ID=MMETSP1381-20130426/5567_1 /TAXON_ID=298111 /ORGANISM="Pavlova sp., Strain CCMP459" /LENGTH=77 /DNA_ID=CAMNT_0028159045 /DNA_START=142 /DNA_END=375 /DNA_ORIENTATION=+